MRVLGSVKDSKLKGVASISCALLGTLMLLKAMHSGRFDLFDVVNISVFLLLGAAFAIASAWLDKRPVLESIHDVLVIRNGLFRRRLHRDDVSGVALVENSVQIKLHLKSKPIVIKSLSIPVSECVDLIQRWKNEASIPSQA
jgi:hypothetical protein